MRHSLKLITGGALAIAAHPAIAQQGEPRGYGPHHWDGSWHGWFMGPVMMIAFVIVLVAVVVLLVRWLGGPGAGHSGGPHTPSAKTPLDILKERFARGEIDKDEYEERRRVLED